MEENRKFKKMVLNNEQGQYAASFFRAAYQDYLSARQLLINDLLLQGCIMANTAIEKYFKGMKAVLNESIPRHHDITVNRFKNTIKNKFGVIYERINFEFIEFVSKSYALRYSDEVPVEFNLAIIRGKTLAELDYLVTEIEENIMITHSLLRENKNMYRFHKDIEYHLLFNYNYYLKSVDKTNFIEQRDTVYEFRKTSERGVLEIQYTTDQIKNDGKFIYDAFKPDFIDGKNKFNLCF